MANQPYTAVVISSGDGRAGGRAASPDGGFDMATAPPAAVGGSGQGTNPEQLFAAAWATCFHSAVKAVAAKQQVSVQDSAVVAEVTLNQSEEQGFHLSAVIRLELAGVPQETAQSIADAAHQMCPYSKATRGNIDVKVEASVA